MPRPRKKSKHGPMPQYVTKKLFERLDRDEFAFLNAPDRKRVYDSSLSKPGRICGVCRSFVSGERSLCAECGAN
jgi:hypothetical protein